MKSAELTNEHFDEIFIELIKEKTSSSSLARAWCILRTFDFAHKLWKKYRIPYKKDAEIVRNKMRGWWNSYPWISEPVFHKMICGIAVGLASPMGYDYCCLERAGYGGKSLITVYQNQKRFKKKEE